MFVSFASTLLCRVSLVLSLCDSLAFLSFLIILYVSHSHFLCVFLETHLCNGAQKYLEELIRAHQQLGTLHTNDWTKQPLPPTLTMAAWQHVGSNANAGKGSSSSSAAAAAQSAFDRSRLKRKFVSAYLCMSGFFFLTPSPSLARTH